MATPSKEFTAAVEASKAEYVNLGKSGLRVSVPILGAMSFGSRETLPWVIEEDEVCCLSFFLTLSRAQLQLQNSLLKRFDHAISHSHLTIRWEWGIAGLHNTPDKQAQKPPMKLS